MNKNLVTLLLIGVAVYFVFGDKLPSLGSLIPSGGSSSAETFPAAPTDQRVAAAVQPVATILKQADAADKVAIARLYREYARLISLDGSVIQTTADVKQANGLSGKLMALNIKGKYPGLAEAVDKAFMDVLSNQAKPLDATTRADAVNLCNGLSWAAHQ